jgi:ribosomal protein S18 acetylase RimI-like enzyme
MILRDLTAIDRDQAVALWEECGLTVPWNDPKSDYDRALAEPTSTILGGVAEGELIATVMLGHDGHRGWMYYLAVSPAAQGEGHARTLVKACEAWMRLRHVPKLQLMVRQTNSQVLGFYQKMGYADDNVLVLSKRFSK